MGKAGPKPGVRHSGQFQKGVSGNPGGATKLPNDLRILITKTGQQMKRDICEVYLMDRDELMQSETKKMSAGRAAIVSCLNNSIQTGDFKALNVMLDRVLGKIPEAITEPDDQTQDTSKDATISRLVEIMNDGIKKE